MLSSIREFAVAVLAGLGMVVFAVGTIGLLRFPGVLPRIHATTKCDTLGGSLIILALALYSGLNAYTARLFLILAFIWLTNPTGSHLLARAVCRMNLEQAEMLRSGPERGGIPSA